MVKTKITSPRQVGGGTGRKQKVKRGISLLLIAALLITGALAFLTATDSKTNVFTIGNVDINLYEDDWYDHDSGDILDDENNNGVPDFAEDIVPGQEIDKAPYVENTGSNEAWVYMTVSVPTADRADLENPGTLNKVINENVSGVQIQVNAYAIQDKYDGKTTAREVWDAYVGTSGEPAAIDYTGMFGEATIPTNDRVELFEIIGLDVDRTEPSATPGEPAVTVDGNWVLLDTYYGADGNNYYVYALKEKLAAEDDASTVDTVEDKTSELFTSVKLSDRVGAPVGVTTDSGLAGFAPVNSDDIVTVDDDDNVTPYSLSNETYYSYIYTPGRLYMKTPLLNDLSQIGLNVDTNVYTVEIVSSKGDKICGTGTLVKLINNSNNNVDYVYTLLIAGDVNGDSVCNANDMSILKYTLDNPSENPKWYMKDTGCTAEQIEANALKRAAFALAADTGSDYENPVDADGYHTWNADGVLDSNDYNTMSLYNLGGAEYGVNTETGMFYTRVAA